MEQCGLALAHKSLCLYLFVSDWHLPFCPSLLLPTFSCFSSFSSKIIMFVSLSIQVFLPRALSLFFPSFHSFYFSLSIREVTHLSPWKFLRQLVKKREILCQARCCVVEGKQILCGITNLKHIWIECKRWNLKRFERSSTKGKV